MALLARHTSPERCSRDAKDGVAVAGADAREEFEG